MIYRSALIALISLNVLIFAGAIVRATGSGLGCPDWPTCWGKVIPPTRADQIDVSKLDLTKFKRQAERRGIDPESITRETVLNEFNPVHTWIEFVNRLTSLPLGFAALALAVLSLFWKEQNRWWIIGLSWLALIDVIVNALLGAMVVRSGLQPGIITAHMAMAFLLICMLVTIMRLAADRSTVDVPQTQFKSLLVISILFLGALLAEGLLGSQVRELTDELAHQAGDVPRSDWVKQLSQSTVYLVHRSFSWSLLILASALWWRTRNASPELKTGPRWIGIFVIAMMLMGVILANIAVWPVIQVLHVGATGILLAVTWNWVMTLWLNRRQPEPNPVST